jgi:hypothetical protein
VTFGFQTVTLIKRAPSTTADDLGTYPMTETTVNMPGCTHRPIRPEGFRGAGMARAEEQPAVGVSVATIWWRTTVPIGSYSATLRDAVLGAQASDQLRYGADVFEIITDPEPHPDFNSPRAKLTFTSEKQTIGN